MKTSLLAIAPEELFFPGAPTKSCVQINLALHRSIGDYSRSSYVVPPRTKSADRTISASAAKLRLLKRLKCTLKFEKKAWESGARMVAGVGTRAT
jgi:hypothetical protein